MRFDDFLPAAGAEWAQGVVYGQARARSADRPLHVDIYRPAARHRPAPVLVWLHGGDFHAGTHAHATHHRLARQLTSEGLAVVTPQYRPGATADDLSPSVRARLSSLKDSAQDGVPAGPPALAAMEDIAAFLRWLERARAEIGITGRPVLGGGAAGAVTAFNTIFLAPRLGLERPDPGGILSFSGGLAWPDCYLPGRCPVFALHNPADRVIPPASVRRLAEADTGVRLIEAPEQAHGAIRVWPGERKPETYGRIRALLRAWHITEPAEA